MTELSYAVLGTIAGTLLTRRHEDEKRNAALGALAGVMLGMIVRRAIRADHSHSDLP